MAHPLRLSVLVVVLAVSVLAAACAPEASTPDAGAMRTAAPTVGTGAVSDVTPASEDEGADSDPTVAAMEERMADLQARIDALGEDPSDEELAQIASEMEAMMSEMLASADGTAGPMGHAGIAGMMGAMGTMEGMASRVMGMMSRVGGTPPPQTYEMLRMMSLMRDRRSGQPAMPMNPAGGAPQSSPTP